jgi:haloalkane dehalogenase
MTHLNTKAWLSLAVLVIVMGLLLFVPAGTVHYWQAWVYLSIFTGTSTLITLSLMRHDPALLERRMRAGPTAERQPAQRLIMLCTSIGFIALLVVPALDFRSPPRRIVTFDFLGWGASDKPVGYPYTATNQVLELAAVVQHLQLERVVLVAHDASGPPAIDWALAQAERVAGLVLLNTYYCIMPTLRAPEAIWLFSTPLVRRIARPVSQMFGDWIFHRMFRWQVGKFFRDAEVREAFLPLLYQQFAAIPSTRPAFFRLNEDLLPTLRSRAKMIPTLREFQRPVRIIFGEADPYLNTGVAQSFHQLLPTSELFLVPGARHYVQMDEPDEVARLILSMPLASHA